MNDDNVNCDYKVYFKDGENLIEQKMASPFINYLEKSLIFNFRENSVQFYIYNLILQTACTLSKSVPQ